MFDKAQSGFYCEKMQRAMHQSCLARGHVHSTYWIVSGVDTIRGASPTNLPLL